MTKKIYFLSAFLIISILLQIYLTQEYYSVQYGYNSGESICNINETLNCDAVAASKYSNIFGIPNAILGLFLNLILFISLFGVLFASEDKERKQNWVDFFLSLSLLNLISSIVMAFISFIIIKKLCIFCMSLYVLSILIFLIAYKTFNGSFLKNPLTFFKHKTFLGLLIAIPLLSFLSHKIMKAEYSPKGLENEIQMTLKSWKDSPKIEFSMKPAFKINPGAPIKIAEFADFLCPHCSVASKTIKSFLKLHPDVEFSFYPYPLDPVCNPNMNQSYKSPGYSCSLAQGVYCAGKQDKAIELHNNIFENQNDYKLTAIKDKTKGLLLAMEEALTGINLEDWRACTKSEESLTALKEFSVFGEKAKIKGTPTVYFNGKKLRGGANFLILKAAYNSIK